MFCTLLSFARSLHGLLLIALHGSMESMEGSIPRKLELVRIAHRLPPFTKETRQYLIWDAEGSEETVDVVTSKLFSAADEEEPSKKDEKEKKKKKSPSKKQKKSKRNHRRASQRKESRLRHLPQKDLLRWRAHQMRLTVPSRQVPRSVRAS